MRRARRQFEIERELKKIGKPVDRTEWGMTPPTVNAYYNPNMNEIVFPAGILQPPFFNANADDAINYGGIGAVIAHEISHGFDDQGRQFDAQGNLRDWWTPESAAKYKERADKIVQQYAEYEPLPGMHINGELTQGENIADDGGVKLAYAALAKGAGQASRGSEQEDRRLHAGAALLPRLGAGLARQHSRRSAQAAAQHRSAFAGEISLQRSALEHAGIPEGVQSAGRQQNGAQRSHRDLVACCRGKTAEAGLRGGAAPPSSPQLRRISESCRRRGNAICSDPRLLSHCYLLR